MIVTKGRLVQPVNAARLANLHPSLDFDRDPEAQYHLLFQIYDAHGTQVRADHVGRGRIVKHHGMRGFVFGDPEPSDIVLTYHLNDEPTPESKRALDQFVSGMKRSWKGGTFRYMTDDWTKGWDAGRKLRAKYPNEARASR